MYFIFNPFLKIIKYAPLLGLICYILDCFELPNYAGSTNFNKKIFVLIHQISSMERSIWETPFQRRSPQIAGPQAQTFYGKP